MSRDRAAACGLMALLCAAPCSATHARAEGSPYRYDDDLSKYMDAWPNLSPWDRFKYIPLDARDRNVYLSFGLDDRERVEAARNALLGFAHRGANVYELHRLLVYSDLRLDWLRFFVQLGSHMQAGREPGPIPTDIDRGDLQQGFVDATAPVDGGLATARAGRFEMTYDDGALIGLRDGPNVRLVWDGLHAFYASPGLNLDGFVVRPVNVSPGLFDDADVAGQYLWGLHFEAAPAGLSAVKVNGFYYGSLMPTVALSAGVGPEETHTFGLRAAYAKAPWDSSVGAIVQTGTFKSEPLLAWSAHADVGVTFSSLSWSPRLGLRGDVLSGGGTAGGVIHTFNPLYPNYAFSTEATIEAPANLIQSAALLTLHPRSDLEVDYKIEGLWRYSLQDGFYAAPTFALIAPGGTGGRWSGLEQQARVDWRLTSNLDLAAAYVHFAPSEFLRASRAVNEDYGMTELSLRF